VDKLGPYYIEKEEYKYKNSLELKSAIKIRVWPFINDKKTSWSKKEVFVEDQGLLRFLGERR